MNVFFIFNCFFVFGCNWLMKLIILLFNMMLVVWFGCIFLCFVGVYVIWFVMLSMSNSFFSIFFIMKKFIIFFLFCYVWWRVRFVIIFVRCCFFFGSFFFFVGKKIEFILYKVMLLFLWVILYEIVFSNCGIKFKWSWLCFLFIGSVRFIGVFLFGLIIYCFVLLVFVNEYVIVLYKLVFFKKWCILWRFVCVDVNLLWVIVLEGNVIGMWL